MTKPRVSEVVFFAINVVFITFMFLFTEWLQEYASGNIYAEFSFAPLASVWSWIVILLQSGLATYIVNMIITQGYQMRRSRETSKLCRVLMTNELRIDRIYAEKKFDALDAAVARLNERARQDCCVRHMRKINSHIGWDDIEKLFADVEKGKADFKKQFYVAGINEKSFDKAVNKLLAGKFNDYDTYTASELLSKGTTGRDSKSTGLKDDRRQYKNKLLIQKATTSVFFSAALLIIVSELILEFTLVSTIANLIYIFFAILSGVWAYWNYYSHVERIFDDRNGIFERELGITDTWQPPKPEPDEEEDE